MLVILQVPLQFVLTSDEKKSTGNILCKYTFVISEAKGYNWLLF